MAVIKIENLTFSYPSGIAPIFDHVNLQLDTDWKLGLIGRNGRGKTTLLNLLRGKYEYQGKISSSVSFDYFPYEGHEKPEQTAKILQSICPNAEEWEFIRELSYLDVPPEILERPFSELSNGEQTKALLSALFLKAGIFLLIDEPTNHLDAEARKKVSAYLKKQKGFLLVSHDRDFLDGCVDHILAINRDNIEVQSGNFTSWFTNFERQQSFEAAQSEQLKKEITRLKKAAGKAADWSNRTEAGKYGEGVFDRGFVGHKSAKMMKRAKAIERRREESAEQKSKLLKNTETAENLKIFPLTYRSDLLLSVSDVQIFRKGNAVCHPVSFRVKQGERIALDGKNGSGKSSLLKLLLGQPLNYNGTVSIPSDLKFSYIEQNTAHLEGTLSDFAEKNRIEESLLKTILRKMDFERIQFQKDMKDFSEGQKKKVLIAKSICEQAHVYVWDEPLNFIDLYSRIQIERLIEEYCPTMIFVEHDKKFRDAVATQTVSLIRET